MLPPVQVGLQAPGGAPALSQPCSVPPHRETKCLHPSSLHCNAGHVTATPLRGLEISRVMSAEPFLIKINRLLLPLSHSFFPLPRVSHSHFRFLPFCTLMRLMQPRWLPLPSLPCSHLSPAAVPLPQHLPPPLFLPLLLVPFTVPKATMGNCHKGFADLNSSSNTVQGGLHSSEN